VALVREQIVLTERPLHVYKVVPTFEDTVYRVVSATDPHGWILGVLDRSLFFFSS
jgi:hypothetical protein